MVSGRGGEFGPEFWKMSHMKLIITGLQHDRFDQDFWATTGSKILRKKVKVVTGDSDKLFGPDAGIFAYNGSELAS